MEREDRCAQEGAAEGCPLIVRPCEPAAPAARFAAIPDVARIASTSPPAAMRHTTCAARSSM